MKVCNLIGNCVEVFYSGSLFFVDFDLGGFIQNQDFGFVNFLFSVCNGKGLMVEMVIVDFSVEV